MKLNFKYMIVVGLLIGMTGCDDNLETFEIGGEHSGSHCYRNIGCKLRSLTRTN